MENELGGMERRKMDSEGVGEEDLQLAYLLPWSECPVSSQGMPAGVVGWDKAMSGRGLGEDDPCDPLEMGAGGEGREASADGLPPSWRGDCGLNLEAQK